MPTEEKVVIHGASWKLADIADQIAGCREYTWRRERWQRRPALIDCVGGTVSIYHGQKFDTTKTNLVPDGWSHDHCAICWWTLSDSGGEDKNMGYTDERGDWVCTECYDHFLKTK